MTAEEFNILVTVVAKEIDEGKTANEPGVLLKKAQALGMELEEPDVDLLRKMQYNPVQQ